MLALSILQPYASAITCGLKRIENRIWFPNRRTIGKQILIHAGKGRRCMDDLGVRMNMRAAGLDPDNVPMGALLGRATIMDLLSEPQARIRHPDQGSWIFGPCCWVLRMDEVFPRPIPWKGAQGLWSVDEDLLAKALELTNSCRN